MSIEKPVMSVVMPVRDEERYVDLAMNSLRRQTLRDIEILVVDDGSVDSSPQRLDAHARHDRRVRLLRNPGRGLVDALNHGLASAGAPLIARMDADDVASPARLERQLDELIRNPRCTALGTYGWRINEQGLPVGRLRTGPSSPAEFDRLRRERRPLHLTHPSVVIRRSALDSVGGYDESYLPAEDYRLFNDLAEHGQVYALPERLLRYRIRTSSISADRAVVQQMQTARVDEEVARGHRFPSLDDFIAHVEEHDPQELRRHRELAGRAGVQRDLARALANGRFSDAFTMLRDGRVRAEMIKSISSRVIRG